MAGAGKKTFTAGETLTASDVNTYLMEQSVMYFGGTAARASAIPTPSTGMTSYIGVTGTATIPQLETYTGSTWQTPYGVTLVGSATFSGASSISLNNVFSSTYDSYIVKYLPTASSATGSTLYGRMRLGGADITASNYDYFGSATTSAGVLSAVSGSAGSAFFLGLGSYTVTNWGVHEITFDYPAKTFSTTVMSRGIGVNVSGNVQVSQVQGLHSVSTAYDGFTIYPSTGTITGTIRVYGMRNS